jgi:HEPN domain-containing protein
MKPITTEWVRKAEADFATAQREYAVEVEPNYDAVCFHSQQAVEKLLKARLQEADIAFRKIHDLTVLLDKVLAVEPGWETLRNDLHTLTAYAVEYRYPGEASDKAEAARSVAIINKVWQIVRPSLK